MTKNMVKAYVQCDGDPGGGPGRRRGDPGNSSHHRLPVNCEDRLFDRFHRSGDPRTLAALFARVARQLMRIAGYLNAVAAARQRLLAKPRSTEASLGTGLPRCVPRVIEAPLDRFVIGYACTN